MKTNFSARKELVRPIRSDALHIAVSNLSDQSIKFTRVHILSETSNLTGSFQKVFLQLGIVMETMIVATSQMSPKITANLIKELASAICLPVITATVSIYIWKS